MQKRVTQIKRATKETRISLKLNIDGTGKSSIKTGIPFFDHMLTLFAKHSTTDLVLTCKGDLEVDAHHTVEDCGIALGQAFLAALGDKKGIRRYGTGFDPRNPFTGEAYVTMDECLARCVVDFSGRPLMVWRDPKNILVPVKFRPEKKLYDRILKVSKASKRSVESVLEVCVSGHLGKLEREVGINQDTSSAFRFGLAKEFFQGFTNEARCNLHLELLYGEEPHHVVEALFKAFARAVDFACQRDPRIAGQLPSTKGKL